MWRSRILLTLLVAALPFLGLSCKNSVTAKPITLTYWSVFEDQEAFDEIIQKYRSSHPNITIEYKKLRYEEYEQELLNAWAEDRGPDIFSVHNTWIGNYQTKIAPLPPSTTLPYQYLRGTIKKEVVTEQRTTASLTTNNIRDQFVDVVGQDVIRRNEAGKEDIYGLPLAVDTLVLYYNRDILNRAGIATIPDDWSEFLEAVAKITKIDDKGNIVVAGTALGTANNIPRFSDILAVLMMQNGARMTNSDGLPTFQEVPANSPNKSYVPGLEALEFYTDFANPGKQAYTWNNDMPDALEAFTQGRTAFFFGYAYHRPMIQARAPQLRWNIAPLPQADAATNRVNFANYWVETVSKKSKNQNAAWNFVQFAAAASNVPSYLSKTQKPTALRSLIDQQRQDAALASFADQLLTARSWYRGRNVASAEAAMAELVNGAIAALNAPDRSALNALVKTTVQKITQTVR